MAARIEARRARRYIPTLSPSDDSARSASRLDAGVLVRYRLDEKRLPQTPFPPLSESLESEFAALAARIDEVLEQFAVRTVAAREAPAVVHEMRNVEKIAVCAAQRS